jgi:taurine transport system permease protein
MGPTASAVTPPTASPSPGPATTKAPDSSRSPKARSPRARALRSALGRWGLTLAALLGALGVWWLVTAMEIWSPIFVPSPAAVWERFLAVTSEEGNVRGYGGYLLWEHLWASIRRILIGSGIGIVLGIAIGLLIGTVPAIRHAFEPFLTFLRQLPPLAYFSLLIIWLGIDESPKIWLLVIAAMPPIAVATAAAVTGIHEDHVHAAQSLGARRRDLIRLVIIPAALPEIIVGIRIGVGVAYTSVVAAETVNGVPGIGGMIRDAQRYNQTDTVILGILLLGISGLIIDGLLRQMQLRVGHWRGKE